MLKAGIQLASLEKPTNVVPGTGHRARESSRRLLEVFGGGGPPTCFGSLPGKQAEILGANPGSFENCARGDRVAPTPSIV